MNYCINLKKRKGKPFCKLINEEISFSRCRECVNKEYKNKTLQKPAVVSKSNNHQIRKSPLLKEKSPQKSGKMKNKSNKLVKLEQNRFSVFTDNKDECMVCKTTYQLTWHEIFAGRNRRNSMEDGFCLRLCLNCHEVKQEDTDFNKFWHRKAQQYYEDNVGDRDEFLARYRKNYLD